MWCAHACVEQYPPRFTKHVWTNHGSPSATKMLKTFDPNALHTAMSPSPFFAEMKLANRFGSDVPAAPIVSPMTSDGMSKMHATRSEE